MNINKFFFTQATFSAIGVIFSATMLATGHEPSVYLPIMTSILFAWLPSPMSPHPKPTPASPRAIYEQQQTSPTLETTVEVVSPSKAIDDHMTT